MGVSDGVKETDGVLELEGDLDNRDVTDGEEKREGDLLAVNDGVGVIRWEICVGVTVGDTEIVGEGVGVDEIVGVGERDIDFDGEFVAEWVGEGEEPKEGELLRDLLAVNDEEGVTLWTGVVVGVTDKDAGDIVGVIETDREGVPDCD